MTALARSALFLSSYAPLFAVFALLDSFGRGWPTAFCWVLVAVGLVLPTVVFARARRLAPQPIRASDVQARDGDVFAYVATYLVPFAAISATTTRERLALALFVLVLAVIYVRAELYYVNPLFALAGYRLFQVSSASGASFVLLTKRSFIGSGQDIRARRLSDYVYWEEQRP
jgi:hypothetical protein